MRCYRCATAMRPHDESHDALLQIRHLVDGRPRGGVEALQLLRRPLVDEPHTRAERAISAAPSMQRGMEEGNAVRGQSTELGSVWSFLSDSVATPGTGLKYTELLEASDLILAIKVD